MSPGQGQEGRQRQGHDRCSECTCLPQAPLHLEGEGASVGWGWSAPCSAQRQAHGHLEICVECVRSKGCWRSDSKGSRFLSRSFKADVLSNSWFVCVDKRNTPVVLETSAVRVRTGPQKVDLIINVRNFTIFFLLPFRSFFTGLYHVKRGPNLLGY